MGKLLNIWFCWKQVRCSKPIFLGIIFILSFQNNYRNKIRAIAGLWKSTYSIIFYCFSAWSCIDDFIFRSHLRFALGLKMIKKSYRFLRQHQNFSKQHIIRAYRKGSLFGFCFFFIWFVMWLCYWHIWQMRERREPPMCQSNHYAIKQVK